MRICQANSITRQLCPLRLKCKTYDNLFKLIDEGKTIRDLGEHIDVKAPYKSKAKETTCIEFKPL